MIHERYLPDGCYSPRELSSVDLIVIHYISAKYYRPEAAYDMQAVWDLLAEHGLSAHYLIGRNGIIWQLVPEHRRAYHAGKSERQGRKRCNEFSLGIELVGDGETLFTEAQYASLGYLLAKRLCDHGLTVDDIAGHSDIAPGRKVDPGPHFDWQRVRNQLTAINWEPEVETGD